MSDIVFSASMIVRNEEKFLEGCLESIKDVVDEIVVVDTGSKDATKEIAARFGARLFDFPWTGDFSAARNYALDRCRGEWILYIDADERLGPVSRDEVRRLLSDKQKVVYTVRFHPIGGYTAYKEYRIFRNDPRIRFQGVIHESMLSSVMAMGYEEGLGIGESPLAIHHTGYDGDLMHKHRRNLSMLVKQIEREPRRMYLRWQLGVAQKGLGDRDAAEKTWMEAIEMTRGKEAVTHEDSHAYYEMICLINERGGDPSCILDEALTLFPDNYLLIWTKAVKLAQGGRFDEAVPLFEKLVSVDPDALVDGPLSYNTAIFRELSYEPLAACFFKLGRYGESERYYALASGCDPDNLEYRTKLKFLRALLEKSRTRHG
ncbi:MAG: glycosyltransferase [Thermodesulfobacteriota bacterium]